VIPIHGVGDVRIHLFNIHFLMSINGEETPLLGDGPEEIKARSGVSLGLHKAAMNIRSVSKKKSKEVWRNSLRGLQSSPWFLWNGAVYAFTHAWVWKALIVPFCLLAVLSIAVFLVLMFFLWYPQVVWIDRVEDFVDDDPDASPLIPELYAFYLVLQETNFLVNILFMVILDVSRRKIYDKIFELEGSEIKNYQPLSAVPTSERLHIVGYSLLLTVSLNIATAPLLTVPGVGGSLLVPLATGWAIAWSK
jgi:hypothetical protein